MKGRVMIFGARKKSIGDSVRKMVHDLYEWPVQTVGISGEEDVKLKQFTTVDIKDLIEKFEPTRIVVTIGLNETLDQHEGDFEYWMEKHWDVNVMLPMMILNAWFEAGVPDGGQYVAISSNSAAIPRSKSMAYCSSKAALSMALRCAARDVGKAGMPMSIYGYEPGLVKGTPMSGERGGTRMLGLPEGMPRRALASQIVHNLGFGGPELNGVLVRLDAGEV